MAETVAEPRAPLSPVRFVLGWVLASVVGELLGWAFQLVAARPITVPIDAVVRVVLGPLRASPSPQAYAAPAGTLEAALVFGLFGAAGGLPVGLGQWLVTPLGRVPAEAALYGTSLLVVGLATAAALRWLVVPRPDDQPVSAVDAADRLSPAA